MKKILSAKQLKAADKFTIEHEPIASIDLMERASMAFVKKFMELVSLVKTVAVVCGPGNNGGDGFAVARLLSQNGYSINCYEIPIGKTSVDCSINRKKYSEINSIKDLNQGAITAFEEDVIIDGIFGTGLSRPIEGGIFKKIIQAINHSKKAVVAIDIPSGLFCDNVEGFGEVVQANHTITFESPKLSFLLPETGNFAGKFYVLDIGLDQSFIITLDAKYHLLNSSYVSSIIRKREKFSHKGNFGRVQIVAGSEGKMGAAFLCGKSCFKMGAGLVTMNIPGSGNKIIQTSLPEAMTIFNEDEKQISHIEILDKTGVFCLGPGIGTSERTGKGLEIFLKKNPQKPLVLDADALNIIGSRKELMTLIPRGSVMTPHAKEFERLFGTNENSLDKIEFMRNFSRKSEVMVVSKGAHSVISDVEGKIYFNDSGNPGMSTAGSGDVLAGMITGLLAQGLNSKEATLAAVYLHGLAGDIAEKKVGETSLMASDLLETIPNAISNVNNVVII